MKKGKYLLALSIVLIFVLFSEGLKASEPVEELEILNGVGYDLKKINSNYMKYSIPLSVYLFENDNQIKNDVRTGEAYTIGETREDRQRKEDKQNILGHEKLYIFSEEQSSAGLAPYLEVLIRNPNVNDSGYVAVCKGRAYDILKLPVEGYPSSSDYLQGVLKNLFLQNFYTQRNTLSDAYTEVSDEGENVVMPYMQIEEDNKIAVDGIAIFNKDKMVARLDMSDTKLLNILREEAGQGMLTIAKNSKENLNFYTKVKRKVRVSKQDGRYKYVINLKFAGDVIYNQQYKNFIKDGNEAKIIEGDLENSIQKDCMQFIKKAQQTYKVDCLSLGKYAAAKYGRHMGIDWNEVFSKADIEVNVKVKVERTGRGQY